MDKPCITSNRTPSHAYPRIYVNGKLYPEPRYVLEQKLGRPLKPGYLTRHLCHNKRCIEPAHLVESTRRENMLDTDVKRTGTMTHYACGHGRTKKNSSWHPTGRYFRCRTCLAYLNHQYRQRQKEAKK